MSIEAWKAFFEIGGVALLFLTFICGAGVVITTTRINRLQAERLRNFDKDLTDAKTELGKQQERAANAERDAATAKKAAGEADAKAEGFRLDIVKANERAAQANLLAEQERLARLKIEERLSARRISPAQSAKLIAYLQPLKGQKISMLYITGDPEIAAFAGSLEATIKSAGIAVESSPAMIFGNVDPGLILLVGSKRINDAQILASALVEAGLAEKPIPAEARTKPEEEQLLQITVGPKKR